MRRFILPTIGIVTVQFRETIQLNSGASPMAASLIQLPQNIGQHLLLLWSLTYGTTEQAELGGIEGVLCSGESYTVGFSTVSITNTSVIAFERSGTCSIC